MRKSYIFSIQTKTNWIETVAFTESGALKNLGLRRSQVISIRKVKEIQ